MSKARAIADINAGIVLATVDIKAPAEKIFRALTDPADLPKWWGQADMYQTTAMTADLRPGGAWRTDGVGADGTPFHVGGTYTVIDAPHRLEFTWKPSWEAVETEVSYTLQAIDGGTRVTAVTPVSVTTRPHAATMPTAGNGYSAGLRPLPKTRPRRFRPGSSSSRRRVPVSLST